MYIRLIAILGGIKIAEGDPPKFIDYSDKSFTEIRYKEV
jgi:hypothetical protein